jgi:hypothetical protein
VKTVENHKIYQVQRTVPKFAPEWKTMEKQMVTNMDKVPTPSGVESIGTLVVKG